MVSETPGNYFIHTLELPSFTHLDIVSFVEKQILRLEIPMTENNKKYFTKKNQEIIIY